MTVLDVLGAALVIAAAVIALLIVTRLLPWILAVLPFGAERRAAARRWLPAVQFFIGVTVLVLGAVLTLDRTPALGVAAATALFIAAAAWFAIRDLIGGIVVRAEHDLLPGHTITAADVSGTVQRVGPRSVEVETLDGLRLRVPYSRLASAPISVSRPREGGGALRFTVTLPRRSGGRDDVARIRAAALHAFFASARREPHIRFAAEDARARAYDVTVYAADPAFLQPIEEAVAESLDSLSA